MYDSKNVANKLIELAKESSETLTAMQILKLVYIAHGWMLALYHRPLIKDDLQAWQYGPVIPRLYNAVRSFKSQPVRKSLSCPAEELDESATSILTQVYKRYGRLSGPALSRLSHATGTPWDLTYVEGEFGVTISNDLIKDHYARMVEDTVL